jgi:glycosyltransferase involved in cell wall biosynthesis
VLLESLARQTSRDYELICIDDLGAGQRHSDAAEYALRKGVPLAAMLQSKPKVRGKRFGQCNAINSGLAVSRGSFITVVQDNVWLPSTFVQRTVRFFSEHERDVLLSYPERRIAAPTGRLSKELMASHTVGLPGTGATYHIPHTTYHIPY